MNFGQLKQYNIRNTFFKKNTQTSHVNTYTQDRRNENNSGGATNY